MQALELERRVAGGDHRSGNRVGVVGGELAGELLRVRQHQSHAGEIGDVRVPLAREDRIIRKAALLGPFDFAVPVGAFDETHGNALAAFFRQAT